MKCFVSCINCSYHEIANYECDKITMDPNEADVCIDDPVQFFKNFHRHYPKCRLWGDTLADPEAYREFNNAPEFDVASKWNYEYFKKAGFRVGHIIPRRIDVVRVPVKQKDILFLSVGVSRYFDRKNMSLIPELGIRKMTVIVSNITPQYALRDGKLVKVHSVIPNYPAFTLSKTKLNELYARSRFYLALSVSEGFGLPPLEASYHGAIPIYVNGHGFKENLVGLPVDVKEEYSIKVGNYTFRVWEPDLSSLRSVISDVLEGKVDEEGLREKVEENAKRFLHKKTLL